MKSKMVQTSELCQVIPVQHLARGKIKECWIGRLPRAKKDGLDDRRNIKALSFPKGGIQRSCLTSGLQERAL